MKKELAEYTKEEIELSKHCIDLKTRRAHPEGRFDHVKRWHPDVHTESSRRIREPSRAQIANRYKSKKNQENN